MMAVGLLAVPEVPPDQLAHALAGDGQLVDGGVRPVKGLILSIAARASRVSRASFSPAQCPGRRATPRIAGAWGNTCARWWHPAGDGPPPKVDIEAEFARAAGRIAGGPGAM